MYIFRCWGLLSEGIFRLRLGRSLRFGGKGYRTFTLVLKFGIQNIKISISLAVEGIVSVPVKSYVDIDRKIEEGTKIRTVASTNMNATSRYSV